MVVPSQKFFVSDHGANLIPAMLEPVTRQCGRLKSSWDDLCTCDVIFLSGGEKKSVVHVSWTVDQHSTNLQS